MVPAQGRTHKFNNFQVLPTSIC